MAEGRGPSRAEAPTRRGAARSLVALVAASALNLVGCAGTPGEHGKSRAVAVYDFDGVLRSSVPARVDPATVAAASAEALRSKGYAIMEHSSNQGLARVCGAESRVEPWDRLWARTVTVEARPAGAETSVSVRVQPLGDEGESRAVFARLLARLGL